MAFARRVVLDTSTLIGAILKPQSIPVQALNLATEHAEILVSEESLAELALVIQRPHLDRYRSPVERETFYRIYAEVALLIAVTKPVTACRDPKDDKFLSVAVAGGASLIVSSDLDLLSMQQFGAIPILSARAFVELCLNPLP